MAAFYFDRAVAVFGTTVDAELDKVSEGKKPKQAEAARAIVLHRWVGTPMKFAEPKVTRRR